MSDGPASISEKSPSEVSGITRIALFGGTFDPIHRGHTGIARAAVDALDLSRVVFLPCRLSPHKQDQPGATGNQRVEMIRLATRELPWAAVDDHDLVAAEPVYSYRSAEHFRERYPAARLFWLLGADQWQALPRWRHPERLAAVVEFIVITRGGIPLDSRPGWRWHPLEVDLPVSATSIRENLSRGGRVGSELDPEVASFITREGLYRR